MIELLGNDAELLAIADAVASTQARPRKAAEDADRDDRAAPAERWRQGRSESS